MKPIKFPLWIDPESTLMTVSRGDYGGILIHSGQNDRTVVIHWRQGHRLIEAIEAAVKEAREAEL